MKENIKEIFTRISKLPGAKELRTEEYLNIILPTAPNSDYHFSLYLYDDGEPQICASYTNKPDSYFWCHNFEIYDYNSEESRNGKFYQTVVDLFTNPTKIVQRKGLTSWSFSCFYFKDNEWIKVYSHSGLRTVNVPPIKEKEVIYKSSIIFSEI